MKRFFLLLLAAIIGLLPLLGGALYLAFGNKRLR